MLTSHGVSTSFPIEFKHSVIILIKWVHTIKTTRAKHNLGESLYNQTKPPFNVSHGVIICALASLVPGYLLQVYYDMAYGGGQKVFQWRMEGTEGFYRGWADYAKGFGDLYGPWRDHHCSLKVTEMKLLMTADTIYRIQVVTSTFYMG